VQRLFHQQILRQNRICTASRDANRLLPHWPHSFAVCLTTHQHIVAQKPISGYSLPKHSKLWNQSTNVKPERSYPDLDQNPSYCVLAWHGNY